MIYLVVYLVWPPGETSPSEAWVLAELVPEEAVRLSIILDKPKLLLNAFRLVASTVR